MCHDSVLMEQLDLGLLDTPSGRKKGVKKAKLGRYESVKRALERDTSDTAKHYVTLKEPDDVQFNFIDLFSGAGGITQGFFQANFNPVSSVELVEIAAATHKHNFPDCHQFCGDIHDYDPLPVLGAMGNPTVHVVAGGPPCQGFSVAGARNPNDPRNRLFQQFVRVVDQVRPWYIVMENVPGILTMKGGEVANAIKAAFDEIGYPEMSVAILESAEYGVPQIRPRAIFIANRFGLRNPYPAPLLDKANFVPIEAAISDLPEYEAVPEINHEWTRHSVSFTERIAKVPPGGSLYETFADAFKRQYPGVPSMTVKENHGGTHIHPHLNRVISAREMARLQSFPDSFFFKGSMKKAMWQIGNAVPPRLAECIGLALRPSLHLIADNNEERCAIARAAARGEIIRPLIEPSWH